MPITVAIIPARSGSKGVRDKNIRVVGGKPLVHHSLLLAEKCKHIDKVFVSTDSKKYLDICNQLDLKKNITGSYLRSASISGDSSTPHGYIEEALEVLGECEFTVEQVVLLQPTNPFTRPEELDRAILQHRNSTSPYLVSVSEPLQQFSLVLDAETGKHIAPSSSTNRQDYKKMAFINGNFYISYATSLLKNIKSGVKSLFFPENEKTSLFFQDRNSGFQVDDHFDLWIVDKLLNDPVDYCKQSFDSLGWSLQRNVLPEQALLHLRNEMDAYVEMHKEKMEVFDINFTADNNINSIHCLHKYDDRFKEYFLHNYPEIQAMAERLLGEKAEVMAVEAFLKPAGTGLEVPMHQDNELFCLKNGQALTAWIALSHISKENGGLRLYSESPSLGLLKHCDSHMKGTSRTVDESEFARLNVDHFVVNTLKPGDIQYHHCMIVHGSDKNITKFDRNIITIQYRAISDVIDKDRQRSYRTCVTKNKANIEKGV